MVRGPLSSVLFMFSVPWEGDEAHTLQVSVKINLVLIFLWFSRVFRQVFNTMFGGR